MGSGINIQVIIFLVLIAFSGISWFLRKLKEQAEIKRAKDEHQRRIEEMLRTGRDPLTGAPASATTAAQTLNAGPVVAPIPQTAAPTPDQAAQQRELAERRREQLRQLRERLAGRPAIPQPPAIPTPPTSTAPAYPGPVARSPIPAPPLPPRSATPRLKIKKNKRAAASSAPRAVPSEPAYNENADAERRRATFERVIAESATATGSTRAPIEGGIPSVQREPLPIAVAYVPSGPDAWRQAIVAAEILGRPLADRAPSAPGFDG